MLMSNGNIWTTDFGFSGWFDMKSSIFVGLFLIHLILILVFEFQRPNVILKLKGYIFFKEIVKVKKKKSLACFGFFFCQKIPAGFEFN